MIAELHSPVRSERPLRLAILLAATVATALLLLPQQHALAGEVHFDADSPAGKEYALPLDQAREEAAGAGKTDGPAGEKAPLFGEGVSAAGGGPGAGGGGSAGGSGGETAGGGNGAPQGGQAAERPPAAVAAALDEDDDGYATSSALLWILAIAALAGIAALLLRAMQRPRPT
jgi:hypothetical protein